MLRMFLKDYCQLSLFSLIDDTYFAIDNILLCPFFARRSSLLTAYLQVIKKLASDSYRRLFSLLNERASKQMNSPW